MNIAISPENRAFIEQMVNEGKYESEADVIAEGLRQLREAQKLDRLRSLVDEADDDIANGRVFEAGPELWEYIERDIAEGLRTGRPIPDHVKYDL